MANITNLGVPYPSDRSGITATTGPSTQTAPGERELFDHNNIWVPAYLWQNQMAGVSTVMGISSYSGYVFPYRAFPKNGEDWYVYYTLRRPRMWSSGQTAIRVWYGGRGQSSKVVGLYANFAQVETETALTVNQSGFPTVLPAAPSTDGEIMVYRTDTLTGSQPIALGDNAKFLLYGVGRADTASDTYSYELEFYGAELMFLPSDVGVSTTGLGSYLTMA